MTGRRIVYERTDERMAAVNDAWRETVEIAIARRTPAERRAAYELLTGVRWQRDWRAWWRRLKEIW